jgi:CheY-like chemotaxis protein
MNIINETLQIDITMPVMDGLAPTREIRRHERKLGPPPVTIIALTGASSVNAQEQAIRSGVDQFFTKPVPMSVVESFVDEWKQRYIKDHTQRVHKDYGSATVWNETPVFTLFSA